MSGTGAYRGGRRLLACFAAVGAAATVLTALGLAADPRRTLFSWLFAVVYWAGLAVGLLMLLALFHAVGARWPVVLERALATMTGALPALAILFVPVLLGVDRLYRWVDPRGSPKELQRLVAHQRPWLDVPFFVVRAALCFAVWIATSELLLAWSRRQDRAPAPALGRRQRALAAGALPAVGFALSFAAQDWVMSLEPDFSSTIFPVYLFTGAFLGAVALLALATALAAGPGLFGRVAGAGHLAALGKLLLGFTAFWFYIGFDQYMLVWIADLPREVPWFLSRSVGGWGAVSVALVLAQFAVPMVPLLSRRLKERRAALAAVALWILAAHALDTYWMVLPSVDPAAPRPRWTDLSAFLAVGGIAAAVVVFRLRGHAAVPVNDPRLEASVRYGES